MLSRWSVTVIMVSLFLVGCSFDQKEIEKVQSVTNIDLSQAIVQPSLKTEKPNDIELDRKQQLQERNWQDLKSTVQYQYNFKPKNIYYRDKYIVLVYHHLDDNEGMATISPSKFSKQLQMLKDNDFNIVTLEDTIAFMQNQKPLPPNSVVITFDDGYESFYKFAYPELKKYHFPATNFIVIDWIGTAHPKLPFLNWAEIKEMKKNGYSFYSHTFDSHQLKPDEKGKPLPILSHPIFLNSKNRFETEIEYETRVKEDLDMANQKIEEELNDNEPVLCFPYGEYNKTVLDIAKSLNIKYFYTTTEGINTKDSQEILRINAGVPWMTPDRLIKRLKTVK